WTPGDDKFTINRTIYVAESMEQAREEAEEHLEYYYKTLTAGIHKGATAFMMGDDEFDPDNREKYVENLQPHGKLANNYDFDEFQEMGEIIVGTPEYVAGEIERQYEELGVGQINGLFQFGSLPHEKVEKSLELYADEVKPAVDKLG
ncbi:hypothetical protein LPA44_17680, partial [Halobacterium sp. KA-4]|uniref:LLM class flavin-dependent oxidoreductase n=1 Tax=Halobacterium sp. KA-4 TaxID=2896367 RepID=UPI003FA5C2A2|nr:hypothetical protein [Halobacterium sp. KA-4]